MSILILNVDGGSYTVDVDPGTPLLCVLSDDLALNGPNFGCGLGQCGGCTVIINGQAVHSCITPVSAVGQNEITTLAGIDTIENPHSPNKALIDQQAAQCGFCVDAVVMTAKAFLDKNPHANEAQVQQAMSGVSCRCFTHVHMLRAIDQARCEMNTWAPPASDIDEEVRKWRLHTGTQGIGRSSQRGIRPLRFRVF